ncbi:uncharacterized protein LOC104907186 [Beta vulgaris subsp. vulgaris]|uniref:uncharacterized protein LOC104907186 n=1 Tax=Beta vulgaris subsp. vulgaris TaxID=3555 RepID=UPI0025469CD7|nr:uncharacterized protein LOC104907186 [Beta vulgaris subsp. vulgaris]
MGSKPNLAANTKRDKLAQVLVRSGDALMAKARLLGPNISILQVEAWGLKEGLNATLSLNMSNLEIEGDNLAVINAVHHCFRKANKTADLMAHRGHSHSDLVYNYPPYDIDFSLFIRKYVLVKNVDICGNLGREEVVKTRGGLHDFEFSVWCLDLRDCGDFGFPLRTNKASEEDSRPLRIKRRVSPLPEKLHGKEIELGGPLRRLRRRGCFLSKRSRVKEEQDGQPQPKMQHNDAFLADKLSGTGFCINFDRPHIHQIFVHADYREESGFVKLLEAIKCGDRFVACSVDTRAMCYAKLDHEEAAKLRGVDGVNDVVSCRDLFWAC